MRFNQNPPKPSTSAGAANKIEPKRDPVPGRREPAWVAQRQQWLKSVTAWADGIRRHRLSGGFGTREAARRRRQIERGQLTESNGLVRAPRDDVQ